MLRELVSQNIFVFTSELYAQVTSGAVITPAGAVVIDTLPFPSETNQILRFIEERLRVPVRFVINTHYHADHVNGTSLFRRAQVISHRLCRELLDGPGREALDRARRNSREMAALEMILPHVVFDEGIFNLHIGDVTLQMWHTPGHSLDSIVCMVKEERILFAADTVMPVPFFADGSWTHYVKSLQGLREQPFESVIQGHGEIVLRGEVEEKIDADIHYLVTLREKVERALDRGLDLAGAVMSIDVESCGKSRIALGGLVGELHRANVIALYETLQKERGLEPDTAALS